MMALPQAEIAQIFNSVGIDSDRDSAADKNCFYDTNYQPLILYKEINCIEIPFQKGQEKALLALLYKLHLISCVLPKHSHPLKGEARV